MRTETIATDVKRGKEWQALKLESLAFATVPLRFGGASDDGRVYSFTPISNEVKDFGGTSGGPIFGYQQGAAIREFVLFAFQSSQVRSGSGEIKQLKAIDAQIVIRAIQHEIDRMCES
jgi:hypothetical protein